MTAALYRLLAPLLTWAARDLARQAGVQSGAADRCPYDDGPRRAAWFAGRADRGDEERMQAW